MRSGTKIPVKTQLLAPLFIGKRQALLTVLEELTEGLLLVRVPKYLKGNRNVPNREFQLIHGFTGARIVSSDDLDTLKDFGVMLAASSVWSHIKDCPDIEKVHRLIITKLSKEEREALKNTATAIQEGP